MAGEVYISGGCPLTPPFTQDRGGGREGGEGVVAPTTK